MAYAEGFGALADPTRRAIFEALRNRPQSVGDLAAHQAVSRPAVSQHLRILADAGLVSAQAFGTRRVYAVRRAGLEELRRYLDSFWTDVLDAYGAEITRRVRAAQHRKRK